MDMTTSHYNRFLMMIGLHFIAMYILMYAMVNAFDSVFNGFNQIYMAALMTASMILIELPLMSSMYKPKRLNVAEIQELCKTIVSGQQAEIDLMKRKLDELNR